MAEVVQDSVPTLDLAAEQRLAARGRAAVAEQLRSTTARYREVISEIEADVLALLGEGRPSTERYLGNPVEAMREVGSSKVGLSGPHEVFRLRVRQALEVACDGLAEDGAEIKAAIAEKAEAS